MKKVFFRHNDEVTQKIFSESGNGSKYFPADILQKQWKRLPASLEVRQGERLYIWRYHRRLIHSVEERRLAPLLWRAQRANDEPFMEDQKTDEFLEIEMGSDDILSQLESAMEKGTKLQNNDKEDIENE